MSLHSVVHNHHNVQMVVDDVLVGLFLLVREVLADRDSVEVVCWQLFVLFVAHDARRRQSVNIQLVMVVTLDQLAELTSLASIQILHANAHILVEAKLVLVGRLM